MTSARRQPRSAQRRLPWQGFLAAALFMGAAAATTATLIAPGASHAADTSIDPQHGLPLYIRYDDATHTIRTREERTSEPHDILQHFTVTPHDSAATTYHVSGTVTSSDNARATSSLVPVYFASPLTPLTLAAVTNARGEFSFIIHRDPTRPDLDLNTPALEEATLYLGPNHRGTLINIGPFVDSKGMPMRAYPIQILLPTAKPAPAPSPAPTPDPTPTPAAPTPPAQ